MKHIKKFEGMYDTPSEKKTPIKDAEHLKEELLKWMSGRMEHNIKELTGYWEDGNYGIDNIEDAIEQLEIWMNKSIF